MRKIGKISVIKKDFSRATMETTETSLAKQGHYRYPGTGVLRTPYKELDSKYRTGLEPDAVYIKRILDPTEKEIEIARVTNLKERLQDALGEIDLSPRSKFWNTAMASYLDDPNFVQPYKLIAGDNFFDLENPYQELTFSWLRVHPAIASSYQAWERGEFPESQFYVVDEEIETAVVFNKKQKVNKAIILFDSFTPDKKRKVARLLGLPISDNTKEEQIYNLVDTLLKQGEISSGIYKGNNPVEIFNRFANMSENILMIKDLVKQAVIHSIYRVKNTGKVYEGELEIAISEDDLVKFLIDDANQEDLIILEQKLKAKKIASI